MRLVIVWNDWLWLVYGRLSDNSSRSVGPSFSCYVEGSQKVKSTESLGIVAEEARLNISARERHHGSKVRIVVLVIA
jgi:hypothetical protein